MQKQLPQSACLFGFCCFSLLLYCATTHPITYNVLNLPGGAETLSVQPISAPLSDGAVLVARAEFNPTFLETGWDHFSVQPEPLLLQRNASYAYYVAGFAEGYITHERIATIIRIKNRTLTPAASDWVDRHLQFLSNQISSFPLDPFWLRLGCLLQQLSGMAAGFSNASGLTTTTTNRPLFTRDFFLLNFGYEIGDVELAVRGKTLTRSLRDQHCSALVKITKDDLYVSHDTWTSYINMVRQYKTYAFDTTVSFSGYAGFIHSGDDWYMTSKQLVSQETTNQYNNNATLANTFVVPHTVSEFMRVMIANYLASSGQEWTSIFSYLNSGSYCNQYMIVDFKLYSPGQDAATLGDNVLWVAEQMPGNVTSADLTVKLRNESYWASFNIPYFPNIFQDSGFALDEHEYGPFFSWEDTPRAQIFRARQASVVDLDSMKRLMRYNDFQHDVLSDIPNCSYCQPRSSPLLAIASRGDLANFTVIPSPPYGRYFNRSPFGATDSKITSGRMIAQSLQSTVVCGPTTDSQVPFSWSAFPFINSSMYGVPQTYNFSWVVFHFTDLFSPSAPQPSQPSSSKTVIIGVSVGVGAAVVLFAAIYGLYRQQEKISENQSLLK